MARRDFHGRTQLRKAGLKRLGDAHALARLEGPHRQGARYLAGYAVECKLKAVAMEVYDCWTLQQLSQRWAVPEAEVYSHSLESLASRLPLYDRLRESDVWRDFVAVNRWTPAWRYDPVEPTPQATERFLAAVERVLKWLDAHRC